MQRTLPPRREAILKSILCEYIENPVPVGSEHLTRQPGLGVSPATVRNEVAALEDEGYVTRPHVSAGGVPTYKGYRYYVEADWGGRRLSMATRRALRRRFQAAERDVESWTRLAARAMAGMARNMAVATFPRSVPARVRHLDLVYLHELLVLLVLVLQEARLHKVLVPLGEPVEPEGVGQAANRLNARLAGLSRRQVLRRGEEMSPMEERVLEQVLRALEEEERAEATDTLTEGFRYLLAQPEFSSSVRALAVVEALESSHLVRSLLGEGLKGGLVRVVIGDEHQAEAFKPLGLVMARYGDPESMTGVVGVIGPMRMEYGLAVAGVEYLASLLTELMGGLQHPGREPRPQER